MEYSVVALLGCFDTVLYGSVTSVVNEFGIWQNLTKKFIRMLLVIVERKSRLTKLVHNQNKYTNEVIDGIVNSLPSLAKKRIKTVTFDIGTEFASRNLGITT